MIVPATVVAAALWITLKWVSRRRNRSARIAPNRDEATAGERAGTFTAALIEAALGFLGPFLCVAIPVAAIALYLQFAATPETQYGRLLRLETAAVSFRRIVGAFALSPWENIGMTAVVYVPAVSAYGRAYWLPRMFARYRKACTTIYAVASAATFFTFFGHGAGQPVFVVRGMLARLEDDARTFGSEVRATADEAVRDAVVARALDTVNRSLGPWLASLADVDRQRLELNALSRRASAIRPTFSALDLPASAIFAVTEPRIDPSHRRAARDGVATFDRIPASATAGAIERATAELRARRTAANASVTRGLASLHIEFAQKLTEGLSELPIDAAKDVVRGLLGDGPIAEAITDVLGDALHDRATDVSDHVIERVAADFTARGTTESSMAFDRLQNDAQAIPLGSVRDDAAKSLRSELGRETTTNAERAAEIKRWALPEAQARLVVASATDGTPEAGAAVDHAGPIWTVSLARKANLARRRLLEQALGEREHSSATAEGLIRAIELDAELITKSDPSYWRVSKPAELRPSLSSRRQLETVLDEFLAGARPEPVGEPSTRGALAGTRGTPIERSVTRASPSDDRSPLKRILDRVIDRDRAPRAIP